MSTAGEISINELIALIDATRGYLGPMWVKKNIKAASNLTAKTLFNRSQFKNLHPLGLIFKEVEKELAALSKGKAIANAAPLLLVAGLGRNLKMLEGKEHFDELIGALKSPAAFSQASLMAEVAAHWLGMGYEVAITPLLREDEEEIALLANRENERFFLTGNLYLPVSDEDTGLVANPLPPANFIYSDWWEPWIINLEEFKEWQDGGAAHIINSYDTWEEVKPPLIHYLDLPPFTEKEQFLAVLNAACRCLEERTNRLSAVILCMPEYLPHLYVRHTLPVISKDCAEPLPKSLLNQLSF